VHLVNDAVPIRSRLADNEATERLVSLLGLFNCERFLGLEGLVEIRKLLLLSFFLGGSLVLRKVEERAHFLPDLDQRCESFLDLGSCPLLFDESEDSNDVRKVIFVIPRAVGWHLELCPIW
jgi:hypothetical protein